MCDFGAYGAPSLEAFLVSAIMCVTKEVLTLQCLQLWLPETPRWLLLAGAPKEEAERAVSKAWGKRGQDKQAVQREVQMMQRDASPSSGDAQMYALYDLTNHICMFTLVGEDMQAMQDMS